MFDDETHSIFGPTSLFLMGVVVIVLACGLGVRLYDLKDPPLDFAATRQLRSALIARGKYSRIARNMPEWKREIALQQGEQPLLEPTIMETIVAGTYWVMGGEYLWIARIYSSVFWIVGGMAVFAITREIIGLDGAVIGLTYYLFAPFGIKASRSFQPDPLMTACIAFAWWTLYRWHQSRAWKWALLAGLSSGLALLVKSTAVFFLIGGMGALLLRRNVKTMLKDGQVWAIGLLAGLPALLYNLYGFFLVGTLGEKFQGMIFPQLLDDFQFYRRLANAMSSVAGHEMILFLALLGLILVRKREDFGYLLGIWIGYLVFILVFSYHSITHYYYHLPLIPMVAISIASVSNFIFERVKNDHVKNATRIGLVFILLLGVGGGYYMLSNEDYRHEPGWYWKVADKVDHNADIVVLSQDYGNRIAYYGWIDPKVWLGSENQDYSELRGGDEDPFEKHFRQLVGDADYFIITRMRELRRQEKLRDKLYNSYKIHAEGGGYVIFDLHQKRKQ